MDTRRFTQNEFIPTGSFVENYGAGTASLTGTALKDGNGFIINAQFSGYAPNAIPDSTADAPAGSPKVEEDGSDKGNWWYYTSTSGTLTGVGSFAGTNYVIERAGPAFQVGYGASGKNSDFGASGWLEIYHMNDLGGKGDYFKQGDFNLDLKRVPDEGATILLLSGALGLFFMIRRRLS